MPKPPFFFGLRPALTKINPIFERFRARSFDLHWQINFHFWKLMLKIFRNTMNNLWNTKEIKLYECMPAAGGKFWDFPSQKLVFMMKINVSERAPRPKISKFSGLRPAIKGGPFIWPQIYENRPPPLFSNPILTRGGDFHKGGRFSSEYPWSVILCYCNGRCAVPSAK